VIAEASDATPEVTFAVTMLGGAGTPRLVAPGSGAQVPVFRFPEHAARAMGRLAKWQAWRRSAATQSLDPPSGSDPAAARSVVAAALEASGGRSTLLSQPAQDDLLASYGILMAPRRLVATVDEAVLAAQDVGWPVALKGAARNRSSRSVASGVSLDISTVEHLRTVWAQMEVTFGEKMHPVTVQQFIDGRIDASVVVREDERGSGTVELGLGGSAIGADRPAVGLLPLTLGDAQTLVGSSSLARVFTDRLDRVPLVGLLHRLAALVVEVEEVDVIRANPVVLTGGMAAIADVEIEVSGAEGELDVRRVD
jgi:acyl-CoA synthetase (NDP forming)